jgi:hypothetical protein
MPIGSPQWMYASGEDFTIDQSLRFGDDDSAYLTRTPAGAGNRKTYTLSMWVKRGDITTRQTLFDAYNATNNTNWVELRFNTQTQFYPVSIVCRIISIK